MSGIQPGGKRGKKAAAAAAAARGDDSDELTKEETQIARFLRFNAPKKQGNLLGIKVEFFVASKLIDLLLESKWGPKNNATPFLANRNACVALMERFMNKQLFYRAVKIYKESSSPSDENKEKSVESGEATPSQKKPKKSKQATPSATPSGSSETPKTSGEQQQQQQKRKFKLEMHEEQKFIDGNEPYVWVYDPTTTKTYIIGSLLILGAIGICLFPLWPSQVREGVYYLSLAGASFLGAILGLAVLKYVVFGIVWACTFGKVHFWLLPNLTEDVGFFESFVPVYKCSIPDKKTTSSPSVGEKKKNDDLEDKTATSEENATAADTPSAAKRAMQQSSVLSGSTVEISSADVPSMDKSTTVTRRRKSSNIREEEDGFELVDDDGNDDAALNK